MSEKPRNEKDEKDEKGRGESWDEKWRRDPVEAFVWSLVIIWAGVVLLAESMGWVDQYLGEKVSAWAIGFIGAGLIVLLGVVVRLAVPAYRRPVTGSVIFAVILLGIGVAQLTNSVAIWALILIGAGIIILLIGLFGRKRLE